MIENMTVQSFLEELSGKTSTPGGGSAAAILGAMGSALISMVANFTVGKKGYEDIEDDARETLARSEALRTGLADLVKDDVYVFNRVMSAYGMPKDNNERKVARSNEIQAALKEATDVPLECARLCREVVELSRTIAEKGNRNVISDAGVAVLAAYAGLRSAALNVYININQIKDKAFADDRRQKLESCLDGIDALKEDIYALVKNRL